MTPLFLKLNLKGEDEIVVINAPTSFEPELKELEGVRVIRDPSHAKSIRFALSFVTKQVELDRLAVALMAKAVPDAILWFVYPKQSSKAYRCEFNRDNGWATLRAAGYESVRMVAVDTDWSALRFRHVKFIKSMTRVPRRVTSAGGKKPSGAG